MDLLEEKKKKLYLIHASTNKTFNELMQACLPNDNQHDFENSDEMLAEATNVMATTLMQDTNKNNLLCNLQNESYVNTFVFSFHNNEHIETNLLKLVKEINAPDYAYKKIINWAREQHRLQVLSKNNQL